jgi:uncharacterized Zn-binding protein involved in type VI secretion
VTEYPVDLPELPGRGVVVRPAGAFSPPQLLVDGMPVARERGGRYPVPDGGGTVVIRVKAVPFDTLPALDVNGRVVRLAPPLRWYEYVWAGLPFLLLLVGGALGGGIGGAAAYANVSIFRGARGAAAKYLLTGLISLGALVAYAVVGSALLPLFRR